MRSANRRLFRVGELESRSRGEGGDRQRWKLLRVEYPAKAVIVTTPGLAVAAALIELQIARHRRLGEQGYGFETEPQSFEIRERE